MMDAAMSRTALRRTHRVLLTASKIFAGTGACNAPFVRRLLEACLDVVLDDGRFITQKKRGATKELF